MSHRAWHPHTLKPTKPRSQIFCVQSTESRVRQREQFVANLCASVGPDPAPYSTASGAALCKTFDETHQSGFHWRCVGTKG